MSAGDVVLDRATALDRLRQYLPPGFLATHTVECGLTTARIRAYSNPDALAQLDLVEQTLKET